MDPNYVPNDGLSNRNDVLRALIFRFRRILDENGDMSTNCLLNGPGGIGKTLVSYLFLIIDEVHNLQRDEILRILNIGETFGHHNVRISFLLISRLNDWLKLEDDKILSRLDGKIGLRPYNYDEVMDILQEKSSGAFREDIVDQELLSKIADIVMINKDLRVGIQILRMLG